MLTDASQQALSILRDGSLFQWYVIPMFAFVVYIYAAEIQKKAWSTVLAGLALYGMDWFNEIGNSLILHFTQRSALWTTPGDTAYLILIGLNIEITFMFAIAGIGFVKMLPEDRKAKILGIPNRWFFAVANSLFCVFVEILLNRAGALVWEYPWWNYPNVFLIIVFGYLDFMIVAFWVYDMEKLRNKVITVSLLFGIDLAAIVVFGCILKWI